MEWARHVVRMGEMRISSKIESEYQDLSIMADCLKDSDVLSSSIKAGTS
jgi:hypothetical protein